MFDVSVQITAFLNYCTNRKALNHKTVKAYSIDLKQFSEYSRNSFDKQSICDYIAFLHNNFKPKTVKRKIATLKAFTHYLMIEEVIQINPFHKIDVSFREPILLPKTIPLNIIKNMLSTAYSEYANADTDYSRKHHLRDIAVMEMLFDSYSGQYYWAPAGNVLPSGLYDTREKAVAAAREALDCRAKLQ